MRYFTRFVADCLATFTRLNLAVGLLQTVTDFLLVLPLFSAQVLKLDRGSIQSLEAILGIQF